MEQPIITAEHFVNIGSDFDLPLSGLEFLETLPQILYTKKDNRTTTIRLNQTKQATVLDSTFVFAFAAEMVFVTVLAVVMFFVAQYRLGLEVVPTTLNGLSQCWAHQNSDVKTETGHVHLSLNEKMNSKDN